MQVCHTSVLLAVLHCVLGLASADEDAKKIKKLQIGVKKRVDPELCKIKSRKGDTLSMHYTVRIYPLVSIIENL